MAYTIVTWTTGDVITEAKLDAMVANDASFNDGTGIAAGVILPNHLFAAASALNTWVWDAWTPTWVNLTIGNGTNAAAYIKIGKLIVFRLKTTFGSTSSMGSAPNFSLPVTGHASIQTRGMLICSLRDASASATFLAELLFSTTVVELVTLLASGTYLGEAQTTSTVPFTWTTSDIIEASGFYQAA